MMTVRRIKIGVFDNCPVVIRGLQAIINSTKEFEFVGGATALKEVYELSADILIAEISMRGTTVEQIISTLSKTLPDVKILVFTVLDNVYYAKTVMRSGASGYILKTSTEAEMLQALHSVHAGENYVEAGIKDAIFQKALLNKRPVTGQPSLTKREKEILMLLASNHSSREISKKLYISQKTVENHRYNMLLKFKVKNAPSLIRKALELDLLNPDEIFNQTQLQHNGEPTSGSKRGNQKRGG